MTQPTAKHREEAREISGAVVRTRSIGKRKSATKRLPFACRDCGGRWRLKADAEECCKVIQCNRKPDCPARSHYGDCGSLPHSNVAMRVSGLADDCACQGGWVCPSCANILRRRDATNSTAALSSRDTEIERLRGWQEGLAATTVTWSEHRLSFNAEVRQVLEGLSTIRRYDHGQPERCWCDADDVETPHMPACLAARGLWSRLQS